MKVAEMRKLSDEELNDKLGELKKELFNLRFQLAINQLQNTARIGQVKREIARILTIRTEKCTKSVINV